MEIAFLGTGIMGAPMAGHLVDAGHRVRVYNRTADKARAVVERGARLAADPAEAVDGAEVIVTMLADAAATEAVAGRALRCAREGALWWQAGTVGLASVDRLAALAADHDVVYVDGPVLGTRQPAESGALTVLAAGPDDALDTLQPLFDAVGSKTVRTGPAAGAAQRTKLVLNHWVLALTAATADTIRLARALDVDPRAYLDGIADGPLDSPYAQTKGRAILDETTGDDVSFPLVLAAKDAGLVVEAALAADDVSKLTAAIAERFASARDAGYGDHDMAAVALG